MKFLPLLSILLFVLLLGCTTDSVPETTDNPRDSFLSRAPERIYPRLFEEVQLAEVFPDSKTFVDAVPKASTQEIMEAYEKAKAKEDFSIETFVAEWFTPPSAFASGFVADTSKSASDHINTLWPVLTRSADKKATGSLIPLPNPYIVPGGRFGEIYYWDSYFTMLGLKASDEHQYMIKNMVDNFAYLIDTIGFIPNGNRTYFLGRSQPPFFSMMVRLLSETDPQTGLADYLPQLLAEYQFWMDGEEDLTEENTAHRRVVRMPNGTILNRYWDDSAEPRPESYKEDVHLAKENSERERNQLYRDLRAACESGWDFSSRWLTDPMDLGTIHTTEIIPVDLNVLIWHMEHTIAEAYQELGNVEEAAKYNTWAQERKTNIDTYLWDTEKEMYSDFDWVLEQTTGIPTLAMSYPLLLSLASQEQADKTAVLLEEDFFSPGGLLTTLSNSGQQWDAPNAWAPLQYVSVQGLRNYELNELADAIQQRWINVNTAVYKQTGKMTEKYNALETDLEAGGGEYPVQDGFGWTNGVLLHFLTSEDSN